MPGHYRHYPDDVINAMITEIESDIDDDVASAADYKQLAELEGELAEREWVHSD